MENHNTRALVLKQDGLIKGEAKKTNGPIDSKNRRVLGDIGNLVKIPPAIVEGKPQNGPITRPITRAFCTQLHANASQAADNKKKPNSDVESGKVGLEPKMKRIAISDKAGEKNKAADKRNIRGPTKKYLRSLTSELTARSKESQAACGLTKKPKEQIANIDEADADNELAEVEYVEDIYMYYKLTEEESRVDDYMDSQLEVNAKMRSILVDWLNEVHTKFELIPETLYLTINIIDRYLSRKCVARRALQLVGISSMLIACKYEEIWAPAVNDFIYISDNAYAREQILLMEKSILGVLEWYLTIPTPYVFLVRYIKAAVPSDTETENMVFYLAELGIMHYNVVVMFKPSVIAASAVYAACHALGKSPLWTETLKLHTGYSESQLLECAKLLHNFWLAAPENKLKASYRKFSKPERGAVAFLPPPKIEKPLDAEHIE